MDEQDMVEFADRYEENPDEVLPKLVEKILDMKEAGVDPVEGAKLSWLCRERCTEHFQENWGQIEGVGEVSSWVVDDVMDDTSWEEKFEEIDVS